MSSNRIRSLSGFLRAPRSWPATDSTVSTELQIPPGYTALSLRHLTTDEQRHIKTKRNFTNGPSSSRGAKSIDSCSVTGAFDHAYFPLTQWNFQPLTPVLPS